MRSAASTGTVPEPHSSRVAGSRHAAQPASSHTRRSCSSSASAAFSRSSCHIATIKRFPILVRIKWSGEMVPYSPEKWPMLPRKHGPSFPENGPCFRGKCVHVSTRGAPPRPGKMLSLQLEHDLSSGKMLRPEKWTIFPEPPRKSGPFTTGEMGRVRAEKWSIFDMEKWPIFPEHL